MSLSPARSKRHRRIRAKVSGSKQCPRLAVFRSSKHIAAQLIDDISRQTLVSASDKDIKIPKSKTADSKTILAARVGEIVAKRALEAGISRVVFDRGGFAYHGRVRALAEGARKAGLKF